MAKRDDKHIVSLLANPVTRERAFTEMVESYKEPLYWKIRRIVISHEDADDVLQNTFVKAWLNLDTFEGKAKLSTWLYRIAVNEAIDFLRKKKNVDTVDVDDDNGVANQLMADDYFDGDEAAALLQQAIASLPEVQRAVFTLRYYDEMKYSEMSKLLDTSEGALKASYHIAVKKIKQKMQMA